MIKNPNLDSSGVSANSLVAVMHDGSLQPHCWEGGAHMAHHLFHASHHSERLC